MLTPLKALLCGVSKYDCSFARWHLPQAEDPMYCASEPAFRNLVSEYAGMRKAADLAGWFSLLEVAVQVLCQATNAAPIAIIPSMIQSNPRV